MKSRAPNHNWEIEPIEIRFIGWHLYIISHSGKKGLGFLYEVQPKQLLDIATGIFWQGVWLALVLNTVVVLITKMAVTFGLSLRLVFQCIHLIGLPCLKVFTGYWCLTVWLFCSVSWICCLLIGGITCFTLKGEFCFPLIQVKSQIYFRYKLRLAFYHNVFFVS